MEQLQLPKSQTFLFSLMSLKSKHKRKLILKTERVLKNNSY